MKRLTELQRHEELRKLLHITLGCAIAVSSLYFDRWFIVLGLGAGLFIDLAFRNRLNILKAMNDVGRKSYGDYAYIAGIAVSAMVFSNTFTFIVACLALALGDGLAGLIGRLFGKHHYSWFGADKTILGSIVFFGVTYVVVWHLMIASQSGLEGSTIRAGIIALSTMLVEGAVGYGLDNFAVPLVAGGLFTLLV